MNRLLFTLIALAAFSAPAAMHAHAAADDKLPTCAAMDRACQLRQVEILSGSVSRGDERDELLAALARTYTFEGRADKAIETIARIEGARARTRAIHGVAMAAASLGNNRTRNEATFARLSEQAAAINDTQARNDAQTYLVMARAYAGDGNGARQAAALLPGATLQYRAYARSAAIHAARGDVPETVRTIGAIGSQQFRDASFASSSAIFLDKAMIAESYDLAGRIGDPYRKAAAIQRILAKGNEAAQASEPSPDLGGELP